MRRLIASSICTIDVDAKRILNWIIPFNWRPSKGGGGGAGGGSCSSAWAKWLRDRERDRRAQIAVAAPRRRIWRSRVNIAAQDEATLNARFDSTNGVNGLDSTRLDSTRVREFLFESSKRKANANASAAFSCNYVADIKMKFPQFQQRQLFLSAFSLSLLLLLCRVFFPFSFCVPRN